MRIAFVCWESLAGPAWTETAPIVSNTAAALARAGAAVDVFTARAPGQGPEEILAGVRYHRCAYDLDPDPQAEVAGFGRAAAHRLLEEHRRDPFAVVHGFDWPAAPALGRLRVDGGPPAVWSVVAAEDAWRRPPWLLDDPDAELSYSYHPEEFAARVLVPTAELADAFAAHWGVDGDRVEVVHPGIDPDWAGEVVDAAGVKHRYGMDVFDAVVLYIGHLTPGARPGLALDAMPAVLERHPDAKLVFGGSGELADHLRERALVLGIADSVRFPGEVAGDELGRLCQACDVVCLPQRSRALSAPYLHAWAAGKPVLIARAHASSALVWHGVTGYVADDTVDSIAEGVLWLFEDFDRCRWVGENGRRAIAETFGWPAVAERLLDCYRAVGSVRDRRGEGEEGARRTG